MPVATSGGGAPCRLGQGDFSALLLDSVLRVAAEADGGPGRMIRFSTHSLKPAALTRYWNTVLTVVNQLPASAALYFWVGKERGEFVASLRNLRAGLLTAIANGKVVIEASRLAGVAGTTRPHLRRWESWQLHRRPSTRLRGTLPLGMCWLPTFARCTWQSLRRSA